MEYIYIPSINRGAFDFIVRALISNEQFIENVDYQIFRRFAENIGRPTNEYKMTVPCLEFFIARKVRKVFDVYRQVFHKKINEIDSNWNRESSLDTKVNCGLVWVKGVSEILNLNDSSKLMLLGKIAGPLGLPLPDYTPSKGILKSASELLSERGVGVSAQKFNQKAVECGLLCELERNSSKGTKKKFKSITEKGIAFGENQVSPKNPKETQPLWYDNKFDELLSILGFTND